MKTSPARNSLPQAMDPFHEILQQQLLHEFPCGFVQSMAFFRTPGMQQSYSGVANRMASAARICFLNSTTTGGYSGESSWLVGSSFLGVCLVRFDGGNFGAASWKRPVRVG
jgi:hypothetical protein